MGKRLSGAWLEILEADESAKRSRKPRQGLEASETASFKPQSGRRRTLENGAVDQPPTGPCKFVCWRASNKFMAHAVGLWLVFVEAVSQLIAWLGLVIVACSWPWRILSFSGYIHRLG